jgi:hypothetical protein
MPSSRPPMPYFLASAILGALGFLVGVLCMGLVGLSREAIVNTPGNPATKGPPTPMVLRVLIVGPKAPVSFQGSWESSLWLLCDSGVCGQTALYHRPPTRMALASRFG